MSDDVMQRTWQDYLRCKFCGMRAYEVEKMIVGFDDICICGKCARLAADIAEGNGPADLEYRSWSA